MLYARRMVCAVGLSVAVIGCASPPSQTDRASSKAAGAGAGSNAGAIAGIASGVYFPPRGEWTRKQPQEVGMDPARLAEAVAWALKQETDMPRDFSTQEATFGKLLGPIPKTRATVNGVILRHGFIVAEFGDINAVDPTYSVAKSYLSTILGVTIDRGLIKNVNDPVGSSVHDGGYDTAQNAKVTWHHHASQTSEWEGEMFSKPSTFIGAEAFGTGARKPREIHEPGTFYEYNDVRINRLALSLLRLWKRPLPDVLKTEIMDRIGASDTWRYIGYDNATVDVDGKAMKSVSGGTRWGGGLWISTLDHARFGYMVLRRGEWAGKRIVSEAWLREATKPQAVNSAYGYLWWLNTENAWPGVPRTSFAAIGAGSNTIWIDPEHDLVVVWRWHKGDATGEFFKRVVGALTVEGQAQ